MGQEKQETSIKESNPSIKEILKECIWERYPSLQMTGEAPDQTTRFFQSLPFIPLIGFLISTHRVVQFGVASAKFLQYPVLEKRDRIGYDYTETSASIVPFRHRLVDLNETANDKLAYQGLLEEDLSVPCDILLIRLLEYLDDKTVTLLLASLIATAKPGSVFYIDFNQAHSHITNNLSIGEIGQFFKPKENFKIHVNSVAPELGDEAQFGLTEQLIITKCK